MLTTPKLKESNLYISYHYYLLQAYQVSCNSAKRLQRNTIKILKKPKAIVQGFFFRGLRTCVEKSNPSESKGKEKLNGACFSCIAHVSREL